MASAALGDGSVLTIVNEQLAELGGAERLVAALRDRFPRALLIGPRFDTTNQPGGVPAAWSDPVRLVGPGGRRSQFLAPLHSRRMAREAPLDGLVITIGNNSWAHAVRLAPGARHVALAHGPPRCLYGHSSRYLSAEPAVLRPVLRAALPLLRSEYRRRLSTPTAGSRSRVGPRAGSKRIHGVPWEVVNPPVHSDLFAPGPDGRRAEGPVIVSSRLVDHKYLDVLIHAVRGLDVELVVVGAGAASERLRRMAPPNVRFTGWVEDEELRDLYRSASVFAAAAVEEFGIALAEAQASGLPVIAPASGGAAEIVVPGLTGELLPEVTPRALRAAIVAARARPWDSGACRDAALRFTPERFVAGIESILVEEAAKLGGVPEPSVQAAYA